MSISEIKALRLAHGDLDEDCPLLSDEEYQYYIDNFKSPRKRAKAIDLVILNILSYDVRERSGQEEIYLNQAYENRANLLKLKYKDPTFNGIQTVPVFGGTSRKEMAELALDPDRVPDTFYKGEWQGKAEWQTVRVYRYIGRNIEPNVCRWYPLWVSSQVYGWTG